MTYGASVQKVGEGDYVVRTNLPPRMLSDLSVLVYQTWLEFATGRTDLGGKKLMHPTGKYASSIRYQPGADNKTVAIFADESVAPEAGILETGHSQFDLKTKFDTGRAYPMHREGGGQPSWKPSIWAENRKTGFSGFAKVGGTGWILPAMPAYSPAKLLADLAAAAARKVGS